MKTASGVELVCALALAGPLSAQHTGHDHSQMQAVANPALEQQLEELRQATERYRDHSAAVADGFKLFGGEGPLMGEHWYHPDRVKAPLDLTRPSTLQYAFIDGKRELVGVAYSVYRKPGDPMPEGFAGESDHWHVHDIEKLARAFSADRPFVRFLVDRGIERGRIGGGDGRTQLTMVHAWPWLDNPDGPFAQMHRSLPYLRAGLPASYAETGDEDAAWGVSLLSVGACRAEVQRVDFVAKLSSDQRSRMTTACAAAESDVHSVMTANVSAETLNSTASSAWRRFRASQLSILTAAQRSRLSAMVEHQPMTGGG